MTSKMTRTTSVGAAERSRSDRSSTWASCRWPADSSARPRVAAEQRYPLLISVCDNCGLVQIVDPVDPEILFQDYSFATGTVPGLVRHFDGYAEWIARRFDPSPVIEFGCNDGTLVAALDGARHAGRRRRPGRQHHRDGARTGARTC